MPRTTASARADRRRKPARPPRLQALDCPFCEEVLHVPEAQLVGGDLVRCKHCGADAAITREMDDRTGRPYWLLVDPDVEADDERR